MSYNPRIGEEVKASARDYVNGGRFEVRGTVTDKVIRPYDGAAFYSLKNDNPIGFAGIYRAEDIMRIEEEVR